MKNTLKLLFLPFIAMLVISVAFCHRKTPAAVEAPYAQAASIEQEEAQAEIVSSEQGEAQKRKALNRVRFLP